MSEYPLEYPLRDEYIYIEDDDYEPCHYCSGAGWGIIGTDWDCDDPINGPYDGEIGPCPCCGGSGKESDATFWREQNGSDE